MRSQKEILDMLTALEKEKSDPTGLQRMTLTHKLNWNYAQDFLLPEKKTEEHKRDWEKFNALDEKSLLKELDERVDQTYSALSIKDQKEMLGCVMILFAYLWLLGNKKAGCLNRIIYEFTHPAPNAGEEEICRIVKSILRIICSECQWDYAKFERRYPGINEGIII
jgi:hypothetical protein